MRGYNPYGVKLSALALFFAPLLNEGVLDCIHNRCALRLAGIAEALTPVLKKKG